MTMTVGSSVRRRWLVRAGWAVYAFALFVLCLVLTFPFPLLQDRLLAMASSATGWEFASVSRAVAWPMRLSWEGLRAVRATRPDQPVFQAGAIRMAVDPWMLLRGQLSLSVTGLDLVGRLEGAPMALALKTFDSRLTCSRDLCRLEELSGRGDAMTITGSGEIRVSGAPADRRLSLTVSVTPTGAAGPGGLPGLAPGAPMRFQLEGTLDQLRFLPAPPV